MTFRPMTFRLKLQQDEATIIHECGNTVRIDNRDIVRLLRNATEYGKLDPDDQQCLMGSAPWKGAFSWRVRIPPNNCRFGW